MSVQVRNAPDVAGWCVKFIGNALGVAPESISLDKDLDVLGLDSAVITSMLIELEEWIGVDIPPSTFFSQRTLRSIAAAVSERALESGASRKRIKA